MNNYEFQKNIPFEVDKIERADKDYITVSGYATTWNNVDLAGDIVLETAIGDGLSIIDTKILVDHDKLSLKSTVGKIIDVEKDSKGLFIRCKIFKTPLTLEHLIPAIQKGLIENFSIGFRALEWDTSDSGYIFKKIDIKEVSLVSFPANEQANIISVKQQPKEFLDMEDIIKANFDKNLHEIKGEVKILKDLTEKMATKEDLLTLDSNFAKLNENMRMVNTKSNTDEESDLFFKAISSKKYERVQLADHAKSLGGTNNSIINPDGGILVPTSVMNEFIDLTFNETGSLRSAVGVITTNEKFSSMPVVVNAPTAYYRAEAERVNSAQRKFSNVLFSAKSLAVAISATWEFLNYQKAYVKNNILTSMRQALSTRIDYDILNGDPSIGIEGILKNPKVPTYKTAVAGTISWKDIVTAKATLRLGSNPVIIMHKKTLIKLWTETDTTNQPIFNAVNMNQMSNIDMLFGMKVILVGDVDLGITSQGARDTRSMLDTVNASDAFITNADVVVMGDLRTAYKMVISRGLQLFEDSTNDMASQIINWYGFTDIDGKVVDETALVKIKIK